MTTVCPTVLADNLHTFREQMERVESFAPRLQIDLMDGIFAPTKSIEPKHVWIPKGVKTDVHLMFQDPTSHLGTLIKLQPNMVIVHAESDCDVASIAAMLKENNIKCGLAILPETSVNSIENMLPYIVHVLIFGGKLGYFGGEADLSLLTKLVK